MRVLLSFLAVLAMLGTANAAVTTRTVNGVVGARGTVWADVTAGKPVVSFPLGCKGTACLYSIWLEHVPVDENPEGTDIFDRDLDDPDEPVVHDYERCVTWVRRGAATLPARWAGAEHFLGGSPTPSADTTMIGGHVIRQPGPGRSAMNMNADGRSAFVGRSYQYLEVIRLWIEATDGNCLMGLHACYHSNLKTFENQWLDCPE